MYTFPVRVKFFITNSWFLFEEESDLEVFLSSWHGGSDGGGDGDDQDFDLI